MPIKRTHQCPDCEHTFQFLYMTSDEPPPRYCPSCGNDLGAEPPVLPSLFAIKGQITKMNDNVYRTLETASIERSEHAAEMLGVSKSETASLKMTDMKDYLRPGDIAAKIPTAKAMPTGGAQQNSAALQTMVDTFRAGSRTGPDAGSGAGMLSAVTSGHAGVAQQVTKNGTMGISRK